MQLERLDKTFKCAIIKSSNVIGITCDLDYWEKNAIGKFWQNFQMPAQEHCTSDTDLPVLPTKGQLILKAIYRVLDSSKKRTKKIWLAIL